MVPTYWLLVSGALGILVGVLLMLHVAYQAIEDWEAERQPFKRDATLKGSGRSGQR